VGPMRTSVRRAGNAQGIAPVLWDSPFLRACRGEPAPRTPVWLMRQAGRYMEHYRGHRSGRSFLDLCRDPEACCEVTVHAATWLDTDAAIIFSDILVLLEALGLPVQFVAGDGPHLPEPIRAAADVDRLRDPHQAAADLGYVYEALRLTRDALPAGMPLIGFCGAPFTLAAYAIEGGGSRQFARTRQFMYAHPAAWHRLCARIAEAAVPYLTAQVAAGAQAVQVFDSWVGNLSREDFSEFVAPHLTRVIAGVPAGIPVIAFGHATHHLMDLIAACGPDVIGCDQFTDLAAAWQRCGGPAAIGIQGNLDPCVLLADRPRVRAGVERTLAAAAGRPGHIFNLGHGVIKESDPELAKYLVAQVHEQSELARKAAR
jgi:uroporphyrinogen decarboxylase